VKPKNPPVSQWRLMIESATWRADERSGANQPVRCALCRESFTPGPDGSATFVEEHGAVVIRVCPTCELLLTVIP
jgi:hypothetical protein